LTFGLCSLGFPLFSTMRRILIDTPHRWLRSWAGRMQQSVDRWKKKKQANCELREWERRRPEREAEDRRRRETELRHQELETARRDAAAHAQVRRQEARSQSELFFSLHRADIADRFSRKMLVDYMQRYMPDSEPPDVV